jgi:hypothetical protein
LEKAEKVAASDKGNATAEANAEKNVATAQKRVTSRETAAAA